MMPSNFHRLTRRFTVKTSGTLAIPHRSDKTLVMLVHILTLPLIVQTWGAPSDHSSSDGYHPDIFPVRSKQFIGKSQENDRIQNAQQTVYEKIAPLYQSSDGYHPDIFPVRSQGNDRIQNAQQTVYEKIARPLYQSSDGYHPDIFPDRSRQFIGKSQENDKYYWIQNAQQTVYEKIASPLNQNIAKNVILFLGDGMSIPTVSAARVYQGGEETKLSFDKFPYTALSKTYAIDRQVADSANTATAYLCGVKANYGTIGVSAEISRGECERQPNTTNHVLSIAYYSQLQRKRTGLVTTARVTHASPSGVYAHIADRNWESDKNIVNSGKDPNICTDIATQLVFGETGRNLDVIMGGGRVKFLPNEVKDEEGNSGERLDGINLIDEWLNSKAVSKANAQYVWNRTQLLELDKKVDRLLGLFAVDHMDYNLNRDQKQQPSLAEMTAAAIKVLSKGSKGYFLFVEGARIDMAHHETKAKIALDETIQFSKAIQTAVDFTSEEDTLIVVTADHAHTMSYSGYVERSNDILAFGGTASDNITYMTLNYANGPGHKKNNNDGSRYDPSTDNYADKAYQFPSVVPLSSETHGGDDVGVFARGPWAHLFSGVIEENVIPHLMSYASCVGTGFTACEKLMYKCQ